MKDKRRKIILYIIMDIICINFSLLAGIGLWYDGSIPGGYRTVVPYQIWDWYFFIFIGADILCIAVYTIFGFYNNLWKYASIEEIFKIIIAETLIYVSIFWFDYFFIKNFVYISLSKRLLFAAMIINSGLCVFSRFGYRIIKRLSNLVGHIISKRMGSKRVMIIGAGKAGNSVIQNIISREKNYENKVAVVVVDDDLSKNNTHINGVRVINGVDDIENIAKSYKIDEIIIAIPSATNQQIKRIFNNCTKTDCVIKTIPPLSDLSEGVKFSVRDVNISDLLFRDEVKLDVKSISGYLKNNVVLVTGGGGSIGSELCRQISRFKPHTLIMFDIYENNVFELYNELRSKYENEINFVIKIGSIRDLKSIEAIFIEFNPSVIFHAAAHKHVNLMEQCPCEAVKNNVFGTKNVVFCADKYNADRFVLLSTDKAVNPSSVMGATKRITELLVQKMAANSKTKFMAVRFGNVLGSSGSVIPIFQKQIENGGPVTVTHPDVSRYFMTIPEAARLVIQAAGLGKSGKIFVLDMGEPVKILDLAKNLIKLSGYIPDKDIKIKFTGLKNGEKLCEQLMMSDEKEGLKVAYHNKIFIAKPVEIDYNKFDKQLEILYNAVLNKPETVLLIIKEIVPNYET